MHKHLRTLDKLVSAALICWILLVFFKNIFTRIEWYDSVAYALPGANFALTGILSLPQLGDSFGLDKYWLLNSPFMVLGPVPFYSLFGVDRLSYLSELWVMATGIFGVFLYFIHKGVKTPYFFIKVLIVFAFLGNRWVVNSILGSQRYDVFVFLIVFLAFLPNWQQLTRRSINWQWLSAGLMPLVHPGAGPAYLVWSLHKLFILIKERSFKSFPMGGLIIFFTTVLACFLWWGRWEALEVQFFHTLKTATLDKTYSYRFIGVIFAWASYIARTPGYLAIAFCTMCSLWIAYRHFMKKEREVTSPFILCALTFIFVLIWDATNGFVYLYYYYIGLGPCFLLYALQTPWRNKAIALVALIGLGNILLTLKLDRKTPNLSGNQEVARFLEENTEPGDQIVTGPPFVTISALNNLSEKRHIARVSPNSYAFAPEDWKKEFTKIDAVTNVYVGRKRWFFNPTYLKTIDSPIFQNYEIQEKTFQGVDVIVARRK